MYHDEIIYNMTNQLIEREWVNFSTSKLYYTTLDKYSPNYDKPTLPLTQLKDNIELKYEELISHLNDTDKNLLEDLENLVFECHLEEKSSMFKYAINLAIEELSFISKSEIELKLIKAISTIKDDNKLNSLYNLANKLAIN